MGQNVRLNNMIDKQKGYHPSNTMRELIRDNACLLPAISRFDIAFGFGNSSIGAICQNNNVDTDTFICVCNLISGYEYNTDSISITSLMGYLKRAHASFIDVALTKIRLHLIEALNYSESDEAALLLMKFYDDYVSEVKHHMEYENNVIFSYVERLQCNEIDEEFKIDMYSVNHDSMTAKLNELKDIFIYHYKQKENSRLSAVLYEIIICERDLMSHFEIESKIFVPSVESLENNLRSLLKSEGVQENDYENENNQLSMLSEREKEIIIGVAYGKVNKEIADELCISVHTVATHRRNICTKLGIHSSAGLTIFAIINHLVNLNDVKPI